ncbi:hypothetical protein [Undibacterium sp.]|uniref:hypothetical protein n=1 Tax=Undibacterium sp. TaxID=1914977 RepID=UPI00374D8E19
MKVFQLIRDVLLGLLALLLLLALLPISASAQPLYHTLASPTHHQLASLRLSPSLANAGSLTLPASGIADGYRRLAQATTADFSEMPTKPVTQANLAVNLDANFDASLKAASGCRSIPGFSGCGKQPHSAMAAGSTTGFLPDPSPWLMLLLGFVGIMLLRRQM